MRIGGIDLGGTKIEARLFDASMTELDRQRIAAPTESYDALLDGLTAQVAWLKDQGGATLIGLGSPGLIDPVTGVMLTANLPATGQRLAADLSDRAGQTIALTNDCRAFTLSEATLGAGRGVRSVAGLVIGTGVAGGYALDGQLIPDANGQHGEFGHLPLPAVWLAAHDVPLVACGCGLTGCFETYLSGPGLIRLAETMTGQVARPQDILRDPHFGTVREAWLDLGGWLIAVLARTIDPDMIILGGGLGMSDGLAADFSAALEGKLLKNTKAPVLAQAEHGDASGALGAALYACQAAKHEGRT